MELNNATSVREMFEQMSTEQLDKILNNELDKEPVDDNAIRLIMSILRERDKENPVEITPEIQKAWEKYQRDSEKIWEESRRESRLRRWAISSGVTAAVLVLLLIPIIPQQAGAESIWQRIASWSEDFFGFEDPNAVGRLQEEYVFQTDIEGLQQVYDAVVALGVEDPKIPTWLPGEPELVEIKTIPMSALNMVQATLANDSGRIIFKINVYNSNVDNEYHKDQTPVSSYEKEGITYNIMRNNTMWVTVWAKDNTEYVLAIDCQEDVLYQILESIYVVEDK